MKSKLGLIVAMDGDNGIGFNNTLPWSLKGDLARFKKITMGNVVIMGRNTWESLPAPLVGRIQIVVSSRPIIDPPEDVFLCPDICTAVEFAKKFEREYVYFIGGTSIYNVAMPLIEVAHVTQVFVESYIDTHADTLVFPEAVWDHVIEPIPLRRVPDTGTLARPTHQYITFTRKQEVK
jgi:dihydrofolate reductase